MVSGDGDAPVGVAAGWETTGRQLYGLVDRYTMLGDHRTGTRFDVATREWLKLQILKRGGLVDEVHYEFDGWVPTWEVTCDDETVDALPLWYCGDGEYDGHGVDPVQVQTYGTSTPLELDRATERAEAEGRSLVFASTAGRTGRAIAINRETRAPSGPGVLLVGPDDVERLRSGHVSAFVRSWVRTVRSANVLGRFGRTGSRPVVVATPLTGWFTCAAERGTGVAVALELATRLGAEPDGAILVATTGHELAHVGLRALLPSLDTEPRAVVHLGSGIAAGNPDKAEFAPRRIALSTLADPRPLLDPVAVGGFILVPGLEPWPGEGQDWRSLGVPVLSMTGTFPEFHTRADVATRTTSPELLARALQSVVEATTAFLAPT